MTKRKSLVVALSFVITLSLALFLAVTLSGGTLAAYAADAPSSVKVNSKQLNDGEYLESNDSASVLKGAVTEPSEYVAWYKDGTLTLNNYNGGQISVGGDLTIKLKGDNNTITDSSEGVFAGYCENLIIDADSKATLNINVSSTESRVFGISVGFGATATSGSVMIKGNAALDIYCETTSFRGSYGIYAHNTFSIVDNASLSVKCKLSHESNNLSYCIVSGQNKPVFNTDGVITLDISDSSYRNYCISANNGIDMQKGTLICKYQPGEKTNNPNPCACSKTIETAPEGCVLREQPYYLGETVIKSGVGHTVTVENGTDYFGEKSNQYVVGETVKIKTSIDGLPFKGWECEGVDIANATQNETAFVMVDDDVTVKAVYDVFIKQPVFTRTSDTTGSVSLQLSKQPYGGYYPIVFLKESGEKISRSFTKDELSDCTYNYSEISPLYFSAGTYRIQVEYGGCYFVSEPFEIDYSEKEPDEFNIKVTDGTAKVGDSTISSAAKGETVTIEANDKEGFVFKAWVVVSGGVTLANADSSTTTFEMPESNVEIKATYRQLISFVEATVTEPVEGETINTTAVPGNKLYKVIIVKWYDSAEKELNRYSTFVTGKQYTVSVKFQVAGATDYAFDKENMVAKINGQSAVIVSASEGLVTSKRTFTAVAAPIPEYNVTLENGTLEDGNTSGSFKEGDDVKIIANAAPDGKLFYEWVVVSGGDVSFIDENGSTTFFTMGEEDVVIKAVYRTVVDRIELTVKTPVSGEVADNNNDLFYPADKGYTATLTWKENWVDLPEDTTFVLGTEYLAIIDVEASDGYVFTNKPEVNLNGEEGSTFDVFPRSLQVREFFTAIEPHVHDYGTLISEKKATCSEVGTKAHYECSACHKLFDENKTEKTAEELVIAKNSAAHEFGEWIDEVAATTENTGTKAHKDCKLCRKHFDEHGVEIEDLTIEKLSGGGDSSDSSGTDSGDSSDDSSGSTSGGGSGTSSGDGEEKSATEGLSGGAIAGIAAGSVAVAGIGGFAVVWFAVKKKSFADLAAIFRKK